MTRDRFGEPVDDILNDPHGLDPGPDWTPEDCRYDPEYREWVKRWISWCKHQLGVDDQ